jgi:hypothetical protein
MRCSRDETPETDSQGASNLAAMEDFRVWRTLQLLSLLPVALCVVFIFLTRETSGFSGLLLFVLVTVGIVIPEMKSDMALNRFIVTKEQTGISAELRQLLSGDLRHLLKDPAIQDLLKKHLVSSKEQNWA